MSKFFNWGTFATLLSLALVAVVAFFPDVAHANFIDDGVSKVEDVADSLRKGIYVVFGIAVIVMAGLAMFTRFKWSTFLYACLGIFLVVVSDQIIAFIK